MKQWKRETTESKAKESIYLNSLLETGFLNEAIYDADRDFFKAVLDVLSDKHGNSIFTSVLLIGYEMMDYTEEMNFRIHNTRDQRDDNLYISNGDTIYAQIDIPKISFCRLLFIVNPLMWDNRGREIENTLRILETEYRNFTIIEDNVKMLKEQLKHQRYDIKAEGCDNSLFMKNSTVTIVVPELLNNSYYNFGGLKRHPVITDKYAGHRTRLNQSKFLYKGMSKVPKSKVEDTKEGVAPKKVKREFAKRSGFLDKGNYTFANGDIREVLALKFYGTHLYNPFTFFDKEIVVEILEEIQDLMKRHPEMVSIIENTHRCYLELIDSIREHNINKIPEISIHKPHDEVYNERQEAKRGTKKPLDIYRGIISKDTLVNLIYTMCDDLKIFTIFPHLGETLLSVESMNSDKNKNGTTNKNIPKSLFIRTTINQNSDLFITDDSTNPFDAFYRLAMKKVFLPDDAPTDYGAKKGPVSRKKPIAYSERFIKENELGLYDANTPKSENSIGVSGTMIPFKYTAKHFEFIDRKNRWNGDK